MPASRRTSTAVAKRPSTPTAVKARTNGDLVLWEVVSELDEDGNYRARICGSEFTVSSDLNHWFIYLASGPEANRYVVPLVQHLIVPVPEEGEDFESARRREEDRLNTTLLSARTPDGQLIKTEQIMEIIGCMIEASGKDLAT